MKTQSTATYAREEPMRKLKISFSSLKKCSDAWTDPFASDIQDALGGILDLFGDVTVIKIIEDEEKCEELLENSP